MSSIHLLLKSRACLVCQLFIFGIAVNGVSSVRGTTFVWTEDPSDHRSLEEAFMLNDTAKCYSTLEDDSPNRYCVFDNTPRDQTFLVLSCPDSRGEDLSQCECEIGIGFSEDAPNTPTCRFCSFCSDGTLNYNCDNLAGGTCIGRTCEGSCIVSLDYSAAVMRTTSILVSWITASLLLLDFF